jgi:hypothetical protein
MFETGRMRAYLGCKPTLGTRETAMNETTWTLVSRDKGARFFRPIANAPVGTWNDAADAVRSASTDIIPATTEVWYVSTNETEILRAKGKGKPFPVRWDAAPKWEWR